MGLFRKKEEKNTIPGELFNLLIEYSGRSENQQALLRLLSALDKFEELAAVELTNLGYSVLSIDCEGFEIIASLSTENNTVDVRIVAREKQFSALFFREKEEASNNLVQRIIMHRNNLGNNTDQDTYTHGYHDVLTIYPTKTQDGTQQTLITLSSKIDQQLIQPDQITTKYIQQIFEHLEICSGMLEQTIKQNQN